MPRPRFLELFRAARVRDGPGTGADGTATIEAAFAPLQITAALLAEAPTDSLFLPCPPVTRGQEVSPEAMEDPRCRVVEAKDWLLHAQNALLEELLPEAG